MRSDASSGTSSAIQSLTSASTLESSNDIAAARNPLLRESFFETWKDDDESPEELQKEDPLGTQMWKLYSKNKAQLPNADRLSNLTWRMMHIRQKKDRRQEKVNAPSGIAQLRKSQSSDPSTIAQLRISEDHDPLDEFLIPTSMGSPAGISSPLSNTSALITASAIPFKKQQQLEAQDMHISRASAPSVPPAVRDSADEFAYVPRHIRKTSIDERRPPKRRAEASPQVPPATNTMGGQELANDAALHSYSLDTPQPFQPQAQHVHHQLPFGLDTFGLDNDQLISSAGPYQNQFNFSPVGSPMINNGPYTQMFNQATSMGPPLSANSLYSPPASQYPSAVSTPQPMNDPEQMYFNNSNSMDMRHQAHLNGYGQQQHTPVQHMEQQFVFNPSNEHIFSAVSNGPPPPFSHPSNLSMSGHVDPSQVLPNDLGQHDMSMGRGENMFTFGGDSDNEDDDDTVAYGDKKMGYSPMDDPSMDLTGSYQWDNNLAGQFSSLPARYSNNQPRKGVTIGTTEMIPSPQDWGTPSGLGRSHASSISVSDMRNRGSDPRSKKIPRTSSTPNTAGMAQHGMFSIRPQSSTSSPPESGFTSAAPSRPTSPGGTKLGGENGVPTTCTNCFTQTTPLWRRNPEGHPLCNACGLFLKLHGVVRPLSLKTDVIKKRNRGSGNGPPTAGPSRSKKSASRKNSIAQTPVTTPTSGKNSVQDSESPKSTADSSTGNTNPAGTTPTSSGPPPPLKSTVVTIAPGPPKPTTTAPGAPGTRLVAPKRSRRQSIKAGQMQEIEMGDAEDTSGRAPSKRKESIQSMQNNFMQQQQMMMGNQGPPGMLPPGMTTGPQEWEWLTMSL